MQGIQFAQFSAEVLRRGAAAVLPQHLPDHWLDALLEEAELFAPEAWDPQEDDRVHECCAGLLGAVLTAIFRPSQQNGSAVTPICGSNRRRW
jgi:hypothetical protein